jgi:hypothetical protein
MVRDIAFERVKLQQYYQEWTIILMTDSHKSKQIRTVQGIEVPNMKRTTTILHAQDNEQERRSEKTNTYNSTTRTTINKTHSTRRLKT